ncbi:MAG: CHASE2 domain-containing protein [Burkholderiales bacterium]
MIETTENAIDQLRSLPYLVRSMVFAVLAFFLTAFVETSDVFRRIDYDMTDTHIRMLAPRIAFDHVVVVDVDEESMTQLRPKLGPWPYDREIYALVTEYLLRVGAKAVAYDVLFSDARKGDDAFAAALDERVTLAAAALPYTFGRDAAYQKQLDTKAWGATSERNAWAVSDLTLPQLALTSRAGVGVINVQADGDGILRRVPLVFSVYGKRVPSLPLALLNEAGRPAQLHIGSGVISLNGRSWPVTERAEALLHYPAAIDGIPTLPFYQVALAASGVRGLEAMAAAVKGRHVIVGSSTAVLGDFVYTPLGLQPGVRVQAMTTELLARGHVLKPRSWAVDLSLVLGVILLITLLGHPAWSARKTLQWVIFPALIAFVLAGATVAVMRGQAIGILFAILAGLLMQLLVVFYRQLRLYNSNQRLELETRAAREAERLKSQFLSHMTHELRTPLTAIMGFNNINLHQDDLGREQRMKNGEIVDRNCQNMLSLVNNLLDQAKIEAGQMTIQRHPESVKNVVGDALATVEPLLRGKPVKMRAEDKGVPEWLAMDAFRLRQIVLNLLSNAIKFTEKGEITVVYAWENDVLQLYVADTGPGMPETVLQRLFGAFQQADATVASSHGGTGLGLTISRNLARLMGGDIHVRSRVGGGTVFKVTLAAPRVVAESADAPTATEPANRVAPATMRGTVLVAEDMPDIRALTVRFLEQLGLSVLQCENGEQAVAIALSQRPDAVLMDMDMPVIPGAEATRTLRLCGYSAPILALTAHKGEEERRMALAAGCNAVLDKPLTRGSLQVALESAMAARPHNAEVGHAV